MCIKNLTKGTIVAERLLRADTFWKRLTGLLGTNSLEEGTGIRISPCSSIHTFGMRYSIDVLFVDRHHRIIKIVANMPAGRVAMAAGSRYVIELPNGTAERTRCAIGDILQLQELAH